VDAAVIESLVGLLVPLFGIMLPVVIVGIVFYWRSVNTRQRHDTIARLIEKGLPVPPELLTPQNDLVAGRGGPRSPLRSAFTLLGLGIGLIIFFLAKGGDNWGIGAIPLAIGLAQLLAWKLERPKPTTANLPPKE
jgi:Domain of unknown function (DUF6249)